MKGRAADLARREYSAEELTAPEVARATPRSIAIGRWAIFEKDGGYLTARSACAAVLEGFRRGRRVPAAHCATAGTERRSTFECDVI
jgi:hypothetical protein